MYFISTIIFIFNVLTKELTYFFRNSKCITVHLFQVKLIDYFK